MSEGAIDGESGAYVPCDELPSPFPADPDGALVGSSGAFVSKDMLAGSQPADPAGALVGSSGGFVAKPCEEEGGPCDCLLLATYNYDDAHMGQHDQFNHAWLISREGGIDTVREDTAAVIYPHDGITTALVQRDSATGFDMRFMAQFEAPVGATVGHLSMPFTVYSVSVSPVEYAVYLGTWSVTPVVPPTIDVDHIVVPGVEPAWSDVSTLLFSGSIVTSQYITIETDLAVSGGLIKFALAIGAGQSDFIARLLIPYLTICWQAECVDINPPLAGSLVQYAFSPWADTDFTMVYSDDPAVADATYLDVSGHAASAVQSKLDPVIPEQCATPSGDDFRVSWTVDLGVTGSHVESNSYLINTFGSFGGFIWVFQQYEREFDDNKLGFYVQTPLYALEGEPPGTLINYSEALSGTVTIDNYLPRGTIILDGPGFAGFGATHLEIPTSAWVGGFFPYVLHNFEALNGYNAGTRSVGTLSDFHLGCSIDHVAP